VLEGFLGGDALVGVVDEDLAEEGEELFVEVGGGGDDVLLEGRGIRDRCASRWTGGCRSGGRKEGRRVRREDRRNRREERNGLREGEERRRREQTYGQRLHGLDVFLRGLGSFVVGVVELRPAEVPLHGQHI